MEVERGETARKSFVFATGILNVTSEPPGAEIFVDGQDRGHAPLRIDLPARAHNMIARMNGWPEQQRSISPVANQEQSANFVFANGSVKITSAPGGATVLSGGTRTRANAARDRGSETGRSALRIARGRIQTRGRLPAGRTAASNLSRAASRAHARTKLRANRGRIRSE